MNAITNLQNAILQTTLDELGHLSWTYCNNCRKAPECEALASPDGAHNYEPRYCSSLLEAAILGDIKFKPPFPLP